MNSIGCEGIFTKKKEEREEKEILIKSFQSKGKLHPLISIQPLPIVVQKQDVKKLYTIRMKGRFRAIKLIDNPFPEDIEVVDHSIDNFFTIPIPFILHKYYRGKDEIEHRALLRPIIEVIYGFDLDKILRDI